MKTLRWIEAGLLVVLLIVIVLCCMRLTQDDSVVFRHEAAAATQIVLADCPVKEEPIDDFAGVRRTYTFSLPSNLAADDCLALRIEHQYCTVRIGTETRYVYEDGAPRFIRTSGRYWAVARLSVADECKTVEVQLTPVYSKVPEPTIGVCPVDRVIADTLSADLPLMLLGLLCIILGFTLFVISLLTVFNQRTKRALLCLAILTVAAGVWKISGLPATTLLMYSADTPFLTPKAIYLYGMIGFLLIPVLIIQFLNGMRRDDNGAPETICATVMALTAVVAFTLQLFGRLEMQAAVPFLMAECFALMVCILILLLHRREAIWLICFPICACIDLLVANFAGNSRYAILLMLCIIVSDYVSSVFFVRRMIRQQTELRDARAAALLNQIRPHFIHNTLTSIYYLCDSDPQTAKRLVRDFNNHLRANFTSISVKTPIPFAEELEHVRAYLSVEQVRFSDKLFVDYDTPHTAFCLPALTLQPLVENAVKHNVDSSKPPVHIRIRSYKADSGSYIVIEDDGAGMNSSPAEKKDHVGLQNVADRLEMLCGGTLTISPRSGGGTVVTVFIPDPDS